VKWRGAGGAEMYTCSPEKGHCWQCGEGLITIWPPSSVLKGYKAV
jgi:hypothetical protein